MCTPAAGAAFAASGLFVAKVAALVMVLSSGVGAWQAGLAFLGGFLADAVLVGLLWAAGHGARAHPSLLLAITLVGALLGLYAAFNVVLVAQFGSPLTVSMFAYAGDARPGAAGARPLFACAASVVGAVVLACPTRRVAERAPRRLVLGVLVALALAGGVARAVDDGALRALGLDASAPVTLAASAWPPPAPPARAPWDVSPSPAPVSAPVHVERVRPPRHVVLWLAESTGARHVSLFGGPKGTTPTLEAHRRHSLRFERYYANVPVSGKAIFTVLCGFYPLPEASFESRALPRIACPSLMETLSAAGFDAALFHGGAFAFTDKLALLEERGFLALLDAESMPNRERWFTHAWGIDDAAIVDAGVSWIEGREDRRTLAVFVPVVPHHDYFLPPGAPTPFGEGSPENRHRNGVHYSDLLLGRLLEAYEARGILDDTLVVFVGDHGEAFEEHPRNKLHGSFLYEENIRAPLVLINARLFREEQRSRRLGSHVDLVPTILALVGVARPAGLQGQSLVDDNHRDRPVPIATFYADPLFGLIDGREKLIENRRTRVVELYDLARDPDERHNLAALFPERVAHLRARVADWEMAQRAFLHAQPSLGPPYAARLFEDLVVSVDEGGRRTPCPHVDGAFRCPDRQGGGAALVVDRVFEMERRCIRVTTPPRGRLVLEAYAPPPRRAGIGLTDGSRLRRGSPLHAEMRVGDAALAFTLQDAAASTSRVETLPPSGEDRVDIRVEVWSERADPRSACVLLSP